MTDKKKLIDDILDADKAPIDTSLRGNALRRATSSEVQRTLTVWEWEEYYRIHGVPESHINASSSPNVGFWQRVRAWLPW